MDHHDHNRLPADLRDVERRLRDGRPRLTALELDAIKRRTMVAARKSPSPTREKGSLMKSRFAVTMMLALGLLMSGAGATLAVSGLSESGSAGSAQYPDRTPTDQVLGQDEGPESQGGTAGDTAASQDAVQPARQIGTSGDTLPFTGFLAIPVLIGGVALLGTGIVLRRRVGSTDAADDERS